MVTGRTEFYSRHFWYRGGLYTPPSSHWVGDYSISGDERITYNAEAVRLSDGKVLVGNVTDNVQVGDRIEFSYDLSKITASWAMRGGGLFPGRWVASRPGTVCQDQVWSGVDKRGVTYNLYAPWYIENLKARFGPVSVNMDCSISGTKQTCTVRGYPANACVIYDRTQFSHHLNYDASDTPGCINYTNVSTPEIPGRQICWTWNAPAAAKPQCSDGKDNDGDGKVDTADPGCHTDGNAGNAASYDPIDISELDPGIDPQCSDNQDNDLDGKLDWDGMGLPEGPDPGCTDANDNSEQDTPPAGYIIPPPTITGPATGTPGTNYTFMAQSAVPTGGPTGRNYRYGFDWNRDGIVDFWTARVADGTAGSASFTWATVGSKVFGVIAEDVDLKRSLPSYHPINISNDGSGVCVPSEFWTPCSKLCGGGTQNKLNSCTLEILDQRPCNIKICGTIIREVPP